VAIVILLAAVLGLVAGNFLNAQSRDLAPGAGRVFANVWGNIPAAAPAAAGAPAAPDPLRYIQEAAPQAADPGSVQTWGNVDERRDAGLAPARAADDGAVFENVWGNYADSDEHSGASLTRPTLR
jgi:hypothetical protein